MSDPSRIEAEILALTQARGPDKSICPSEVARNLAQEWRPMLHPVRQEAVRLALAGRIDLLRKGKPIDPAEMRGVIRLRAKSAG